MSVSIRGVVRQLGSHTDPPSDAELLIEFAAQRDAAAFAALIARFGPPVFGVCRRILGNSHDAEDAFQAVFLVLAQKAGTVQPPGSVGGWLYGVAVRTANKLKVAAARRRRREMIAAAQSTQVSEATNSAEQLELSTVLDQELAKLPAQLRDVIVLCELHGRTRSQAAAELRCPEGTVSTRLHRGRKKLAEALTRRGLALPAAGLAAVLTPAAVPAALVKSALALAAGSPASPIVSALAREVIRSTATTAHAITSGFVALVAGGLLAAGALWSSEAGDAANAPTSAGLPRELPGNATKMRGPEVTEASDPEKRKLPREERAKVNEARIFTTEPEPEKREQPAPPAPATASRWREKTILLDAQDIVHSVAFAPDGKSFTAGGAHGSVTTWNAADLKVRRFHLDEIRGRIPAAVAYSPDGRLFAQTSQEGVLVEDPKTWKSVFIKPLPGEMPRIEFLKGIEKPTALAFGKPEEIDGKNLNRLAMTDGHAVVAAMWLDGVTPSTAKLGPMAGAPKVEGAAPAGVAYSPNARQLVFIPNYKLPTEGLLDRANPEKNTHWIALVWGAGSGLPMEFLRHGTRPVAAVAWSGDGKFIATGGAGGEVVLWDTASFKEVHRTKMADGSDAVIRALAFAPDGKTLAVAAEQEEGKSPEAVQFLNVQTMKWSDGPLSMKFVPNALAYSPDGKTLIVGGGDRRKGAEVANPREPNKSQVRVYTAVEPGR